VNLAASAVLFDLDGTLIDSSPAHAEAYRWALRQIAPELLSEFDYDRLRGLTTADGMRLLGAVAEDVPELSRLKQQQFRHLAGAGAVVALPGAEELLGELVRLGIDRYVVTSGSATSAALAMKGSGLAPLVLGVITSDDVDGRGKPDPAPYRAALDRFGLEATGVIVVEDALSGVQSARAAGLVVAAVHDRTLADLADWWFADLPGLQAWFTANLAL